LHTSTVRLLLLYRPWVTITHAASPLLDSMVAHHLLGLKMSNTDHSALLLAPHGLQTILMQWYLMVCKQLLLLWLNLQASSSPHPFTERSNDYR
jgi:hypothetical protein